MNEKQIDRVMRAIMLWEGDFPPEWNAIPKQRMDRLRDQAEAAIRAAFTPLPMEDAPTHEESVLLKTADGWAEAWYHSQGGDWVCCDDKFEVAPDTATGWLPLPEEQDACRIL